MKINLKLLFPLMVMYLNVNAIPKDSDSESEYEDDDDEPGVAHLAQATPESTPAPADNTPGPDGSTTADPKKEACDNVDMVSWKDHYVVPLKVNKSCDMVKILVIGGNSESSGPPYFAAMGALKAGADLVYVMTTEESAPIVKAYSPDLIVYPYFARQSKDNIDFLYEEANAIVIGPGLGKGADALKEFKTIVDTTKKKKKPLILTSFATYFISKCKEAIKNYPGAIILANQEELCYLKNKKGKKFNNYGKCVAILEKGDTDKIWIMRNEEWNNTEPAISRRVSGYGDIMAGILATFYSWAMKSSCKPKIAQAQKISGFAASTVMRKVSQKAFGVYGRSLSAVDMISEMYHVMQEVLPGGGGGDGGSTTPAA